MAGSQKIIPVNTALLSYGMSGSIFHAPFLKVSPYFHLSSVWERSKSLSKKLFPEIKIYRTLEELLLDNDIELVIVNTPNNTHYDYAMKALKAGKHVVVEKPFTINSRQGQLLKRIAEKNNLVLSVYHNRRYDSDFRTLRKVLKSKSLGNIVEAEFRFDRFRQHPGKKIHKESPGPGTGNLYDLGSHLIDQALMLFGWPQKVFADIDILRKDSRVDDYFEIILFYEEMRVRLHSSYLVMDTLPESILYGEKGSFIKPKGDIQEATLSRVSLPEANGWGIDTKPGILKRIIKDNIIETSVPAECGNYGSYYDELYPAIRGKKQPPVTPDQAIKVIRIIEMAYKSHRLRKTISLPKE